MQKRDKPKWKKDEEKWYLRLIVIVVVWYVTMLWVTHDDEELSKFLLEIHFWVFFGSVVGVTCVIYASLLRDWVKERKKGGR